MTEAERLKRTLIRYCYFYYVKAKSLVSDSTYDGLFKRLQELEGDTVVADSPTQMIYGDLERQYPEWAKVL